MYIHTTQAHAHKYMYWQTDRQTYRETDIQRDRQTWMYCCLHALKLQCQLLSQVGALQCPNDRDKRHCVELYFETDINMIIK